jgi:redox-sensitive bicupin YhaK (pirin superfamily)
MKVLRRTASPVFAQGRFQVRRIRPGVILDVRSDPAFGPLSVIDHANLAVDTVVGMHEHKNDEILSYLWRGTMFHEDSAGHRVPVSPKKLMMMNAGKSFWHEESAPDGPVEMLQIFVRPRAADLHGQVQFYDRPFPLADGQWQVIAGPESSDAKGGFVHIIFV